MRGLSLDVELLNQLAPLQPDRGFRSIVNKRECTLEICKMYQRLSDREPKPVLCPDRTSRNGPKLIDNLRHETWDVSTLDQRDKGRSRNFVLWMAGLSRAGEDIRIQQDLHSPRPSYMLSRLSSATYPGEKRSTCARARSTKPFNAASRSLALAATEPPLSAPTPCSIRCRAY